MTTPDLSRVTWRKSRRSEDNGGQCVEVAVIGSSSAIRDSKNPTGGTLVLKGTARDGFWAAVRLSVR